MTLFEIRQTSAYRKLPSGLHKASLSKKQLLKLLDKKIIFHSSPRRHSPRRHSPRRKSPRRYSARYYSPIRYVRYYTPRYYPTYDDSLYWYAQKWRNLANWSAKLHTPTVIHTRDSKDGPD